MNPGVHRQRGFSLIAAIFLITAVAAIVAAMVATLSDRSRTSVQNLEASRAFYAAQSGIEVAVARALAGGCAAVPASLALEGFSLGIACSAEAVDEAGVGYAVYNLNATASAGDLTQSTYVSRRVRATVTDAP